MKNGIGDKKIVLGISGSIAAYKSACLARVLIKEGTEVQVVMTPSAKEFITPLTMSALTGKPVVSEFFSANDGTWHSHVDLGLWADLMLVAPATASTIAKMANGVADNMLVTTYLSMKAPVFVAPAMDLDMYVHPSTQRNLSLLRTCGNHIIEPGTGFLASGLEGKGRMEEPDKIVEYLETYFSRGGALAGKRILITAGPTYERLDPVRYIGNFSSGKMGFSLAEVCAERGADVVLVTGPVNLRIKNCSVRRIDVESAAEMESEVQKYFKDSDITILSAAVADYRPVSYSEKKIKRKDKENWALSLVPNEDIAAELGKIKTDKQILVGFALEAENESENAVRKLESKNLDFIVLNSLKDAGAGFRFDTNKISIIGRSGKKTDYPLKLKKEVAADIIDEIEQLLER